MKKGLFFGLPNKTNSLLPKVIVKTFAKHGKKSLPSHKGMYKHSTKQNILPLLLFPKLISHEDCKIVFL